MTPQETDPELPVSVQESLVKPWVGGVLLQVSSSACMGTFERSHHYLHYLHHSLASGQKAGRAHRPTHQQKIGLKIYWAWPHISEQDPYSPTASISHPGSFHKPLTLIHQRADKQDGNHNYRKLTKLITWITALSNSMKLWAMPYRAIQDRWVMVESSDKTWSTGGGTANHFSILALRTPWTVWKGKKIGHWKMNSPGQ